MSIIEQATKRLEELRRAGIDVNWNSSDKPSVRLEPVIGDAPAVDGATAAVAAPAVSAPAQAAVATPVAAPAVVAAPVVAPVSTQRPGARSKLVNIDLPKLASEGYLTPDDPRSVLAEELRAVKRPIIEHVHRARSAGRPNANLILVTSALPGEGKTYTAINLAMSIAMEVDHSVLLVDADVVRPSVPGRLGIPAELGMLDVLNKPSIDLSDVLIRTNIPKLSILPAGSAMAKSTELLASGAMEKLLAEVAARYADRIVIFDGPPLLATSESRVLASRMGQVVMVVEANKTARSSVTKAFAAIESCETVWCVLNKAVSERTTGGYGRYAYQPADEK